ncbi:MAG: transaldolase [Pseudomonadota bacterium]|jgi:transaldolase
MTSRIFNIKQYGQKIWLDNISREFLASGELHNLINHDGIAGITSNPAIFYKAISSDQRYQEQLHQLKHHSLSALQRYEALAIEDIKQACSIMLPLYNSSQAEDGYVSLEVAPELCHDSEGTIKSALELWNSINYPNLMIKVPATPAGIQALEQLIILGLNVNITLLFSLTQVNAVWQAYLNGLEARVAQGLAIDKIKAVASFFLSRIDSAVDHILPSELQGKAAVNLARQAYVNYLSLFNSERFKKLQHHGAKEQYLLWASTGTKNANYSDVLYIEELIGAQTINTVPDATLNAFRDHGQAKNSLTPENLHQAELVLAQIEQAGVNFEQLGEQLQQEGLALFVQAFDKLLSLVA